MRVIAPIIVVALVSGCASMAQVKARKASGLSSPALCYVAYAGDATDKIAAQNELSARDFACSNEAVVMGQTDFLMWQQRSAQNEAQSRALAAEIGLRLLTPPTPPPAPVTCQTWQYGHNGTIICR